MRLNWLLLPALFAAAGLAAAADTDKAKAIVEKVCGACHGIDGNSVVPSIPKLAGRHADYLVHEIKQFQSGVRQSDIMSPVVATLTDSEVEALGEYFSKQKPTTGKVTDPKLAEAGKKLYQQGDEAKGIPSCRGCHTADGRGTRRFPRLAGQHREYLIAEMNAFKAGKRNYPSALPMVEVAKLMSDDEIKAVAEYMTGM